MYIDYPKSNGEFENEIVHISEETKASKWQMMWEFVEKKLDLDFPVKQYVEPAVQSCKNFFKNFNFKNFNEEPIKEVVREDHKDLAPVVKWPPSPKDTMMDIGDEPNIFGNLDDDVPQQSSYNVSPAQIKNASWIQEFYEVGTLFANIKMPQKRTRPTEFNYWGELKDCQSFY